MLLIKDMHKEIILGTPFLALLYLFKVDSEGIKTVYKGKSQSVYIVAHLQADLKVHKILLNWIIESAR